MENCFKGTHRIDRRFDLKGSWVSRVTKTAEAQNNPSKTLKDVDALMMHNGINVAPDMAQLLTTTLQRDSLFLAQHQIIDYSLLLGLHNNSVEEIQKYEMNQKLYDSTGKSLRQRISESHLEFYELDDGGMVSKDFTQTFYVGIIDILTEYNETKKAEKFFKLFAYSARGVSVQRPPTYQERFMDFMGMLIGKSRKDFTNGSIRLPRHWRRVLESAEKYYRK